jgi:hypothetical protein
MAASSNHRGPGRQDHQRAEQVAEKVVAGQGPFVAKPEWHDENPEGRRDAKQHRHQLRRTDRQLPAEQQQYKRIHHARRVILAHQATPLPGGQRGNRCKCQLRRQRRQGKKNQSKNRYQQECGDDPRPKHRRP